ncbi:glycoside hydrolase family 15 protein [Dyella sp. C11]|uniref:glycoside hydrolase family 15 protein n=1 Tax=Dyella sp. C11 TaxID=2126991 RepID=UPI000D641706|nr:glycoside hydrolase family 15 protein [Dyella sp. C11]
MPARIEDYAMIGDCKTAALVSRDGSIAWLCLPRFDSMSCFSCLVGSEDQGHWRVGPAHKGYTSSRAYVDGSLVLNTRFENEGGKVEVVDFMPPGFDGSHVVRMVKGVSGRMVMRSSMVVRFDYGVIVPWVASHDDGTLELIAGPDLLVLRSDVECEVAENAILATFEVNAGDTVSFVLSHGASYLPAPAPVTPEDVLQLTEKFWSDWSSQCTDAGQWTPAVRRSLATLKGLIYGPTGGMVAAVTTSLPEMIGGERNWDYRYCWLRDASFTLLALLTAGYRDEAVAWRLWLIRAIAGDPAQIQIMYGVAGERRLDEWTAPWLGGYEASTPVRIGNAAAQQLQLDIFGEISNVMAIAMSDGLPISPRGIELRDELLDHLAEIWTQPDYGIWEVRGDPQHFTHSKVMVWVAFDRAATYELRHGNTTKHAHYRDIANQIRDSVCANAVDKERNCFVQVYGGHHLDASLLLLPMVGFLPPTDERVRNTVAQIEQRLMVDGLVLRYETESGVDGLPAGEGAFLACSFWLVENHVMQGDLEKATTLFEYLLSLGNDLGLFSEEYDPRAKRQLGNFPQAFSHVALVNAAFALAKSHAQTTAGG